MNTKSLNTVQQLNFADAGATIEMVRTIDKLSPQSVQPLSLFYIMKDYQDGYIQKPPHQRDIVWTDEQRKEWVKRLSSPIKPVGVIVTYELVDSPGIRYLNDGWQRLSSTLDFTNNPAKYGFSEEDAYMIVRSQEIPLQHRIYERHEEALVDFQYLNVGTRLTPYEFYRGVLAYMGNYKLFEGIFNKLHSITLELARDTISQTALTRLNNNREITHKARRNDYALFLRYCADDKLVDFGTPAQSTPSMEDAESDNLTERLMGNLLERLGLDEAQQKLEKLDKLLGREVREVKETWKELDIYGDSKTGITLSTYQWLMHCIIWKDSERIRNIDWRDFLKKLLLRGGGGSTIVNPNNPRQKAILTAGNLRQNLAKVCDIVGSDIYKGRRRSRSDKLRPKEGIDRSHVLNFDTHGDGDVILEPSGRNRARGSKDISSEEYEIEDQ